MEANNYSVDLHEYCKKIDVELPGAFQNVKPFGMTDDDNGIWQHWRGKHFSTLGKYPDPGPNRNAFRISLQDKKNNYTDEVRTTAPCMQLPNKKKALGPDNQPVCALYSVDEDVDINAPDAMITGANWDSRPLSLSRT